MRRITLPLTAAVLFAMASISLAQSPTPVASPVESATPTKGHKQKKATPAPTATPAPAATAAPAATPAPEATPAKKSRARKKADKAEAAAEETPTATVAPGGGPGMVWVNTKTHKFHPEGSRYYGKTKEGKYLSEKDALAEGDILSGTKKNVSSDEKH